MFALNSSTLILGAYAEITEIELERYSAQGEGIAIATRYFLHSKGVKDIDELNPHKHLMQIREAKEWMNPTVARRFLDLSRGGKVPPWAIDFLEEDLKRIRLAAI